MSKVISSIVVWPDDVLDEPTAPVREFGPPLEELLERMHKAVVEAEGIGLAANQIGVPLKVALVGRGDATFLEVINGEILERSEPVELEEGCLSIPGEWHKVPRFRKVRVRYQDSSGQLHEEIAEDKLAHVFQHEIDHLEGRVFARHLSALKRDLIRTKMKKFKRARKDGERE